MELVKRNAKALLLLALIVLALVAEAVGVDIGLDLQHYIVLLLTDLGVWAVPNKPPTEQPKPIED